MLNRSQVYAALAIAVVVWAVLLLIQGTTLQPSYLRPYSFAVAAIVVCFEVFDRWLWRMGPIATIVGRPVLRGTWKGVFKSTWVDPSTGLGIDPRGAFLVIRQTYSRLSTQMLTAESKSVSLVTSFDTSSDAPATVQWTYRNTPELLIQGRSRIHHGAVVLEVHGLPPARLTGFYWTDRDTKGELFFDTHSSTLHTDFEGASSDTNLSSPQKSGT
jgi:hypothetical protein